MRVLVGYGTGGSTDTTARLVAQQLGDQLGRSFLVENRPGGDGVIGSEMVPVWKVPAARSSELLNSAEEASPATPATDTATMPALNASRAGLDRRASMGPFLPWHVPYTGAV